MNTKEDLLTRLKEGVENKIEMLDDSPTALDILLKHLYRMHERVSIDGIDFVDVLLLADK